MTIVLYHGDNLKLTLNVQRFIGTILWFAGGVLVGSTFL